jgi:hypothetical protein
MNTRNLIKRAIAVLNLSRVINKLILQAKAIATAMQGNAYFPALAAQLLQLIADIKTLEDIVDALNTKQPDASIEKREAAHEVVKADLRTLRMEVQKVADKDLEYAEAIIISAGMAVKLLSVRGKQQNTATDGQEEGSIKLTAEGAGPHEWRISIDGITWTIFSSTLSSSTTAVNLVSGTIYYFQNRKVLRFGKKGEWSPVIKLRVR